MGTKSLIGIILVIILLSFPACYLADFEQEIEVEIVFDSRAERGEILASHFFDINEYSSDFRNNKEHVEEIVVISISGKLNEFSGPAGQVLTNGVLTIADQDGNGPAILALLPSVDLQELFFEEQYLDMEEAGRQRLEELLLNDPNTCLGTFTGEVDQPPSGFIITFYIKAIIRGNLL